MYIYSGHANSYQGWGTRALGQYSLGEPASTAKQIYSSKPQIKSLTDADFWNIFSDKNKVVVVSFWSDGCPPCNEVARQMVTLAENTSRRGYAHLVKFYQIQWDPKVNPQIHQRFGFKGKPVVFFYYTSTGNPPRRTAPLLEGSLGPDDKWHVLQEYEWRIKSILRRHGHTFEARIILIDLAGFFTGKAALKSKFTSDLQAKFNNLEPKWLFEQLLKFRVSYKSNEPTPHEKANFGKLDFPIYLLGQHHTENFVKQLMREHQIPNSIQCPMVRSSADPFALAESCWQEKEKRGCGIPPGQGFRKVGFIKTHAVARDPVGKHHQAQAFLNVTSHELGHMLNICNHSSAGLMKSPVRLDVNLDFAPSQKGFLLGSLVRLRDF